VVAVVAIVNETCASETETPSENPPTLTAAGPVLVNVRSNELPLEGEAAVALPAVTIKLAQSGAEAANARPSTATRAYAR